MTNNYSFRNKMSFNKYPFKITKVLNNNLLQGKLKYEKSFINITIRLYAINFSSNKSQEIYNKINSLVKRKDLEIEILEVGKYGIYEGNIYYLNNKLFNKELVDENLATYEYKEECDHIQNRKNLIKIIEEEERRCELLNIPSITKIVNSKYKTF